MRFKTFVYALFFFLFALEFAQAQGVVVNKCGTDEYHLGLDLSNPSLPMQREETEMTIQKWIRENPGTASVRGQEIIYTIPVVFHVLYYDLLDNISLAQIDDALVRLNKDFRRLNADTANLRAVFKPRAADMSIEFVRARIAPDGSCTKGVTRTQTALSLNANDNVKNLLAWDNKKYLNIWVVRNISLAGTPPGTITLGYAAFPFNGLPANQDGIVIRHDQVGGVGTSSSLGRTLTHEMGHYFNLYHTFQSGCLGGDNCADTPPVSTSSDGCDKTQNSCTNDVPDLPDMVENYMDYSDDVCMNTFTLDQRARAMAVLSAASLRGSLGTTANLMAVGLNTLQPACVPQADFLSNKRILCSGESVQFTEMATTYKTAFYHWTIMDANGNNQQHIMTANPLVTFSVPGFYKVELNVANSDGSHTLTRPGYIAVFPASGITYTPHFSASFENLLPNNSWALTESGDNIGWETTNLAFVNGSKSVRIRNFDIKSPGGGDALISAPIVTGGSSSVVLKFFEAYARKDGNSADQLKVYISKNCGSSWELVRIFTATQLNTSSTAISGGAYVPSATAWKEHVLSLGANLAGANKVMIKLEAVNAGGNNLYLDDVRLSYTIGSEEWTVPLEWVVSPNPSSGLFEMKWPEADPSALPKTIVVLDATGRPVHTQPTQTTETVLDLRAVPSGLYIVLWGPHRARIIKQ